MFGRALRNSNRALRSFNPRPIISTTYTSKTFSIPTYQQKRFNSSDSQAQFVYSALQTHPDEPPGLRLDPIFVGFLSYIKKTKIHLFISTISKQKQKEKLDNQIFVLLSIKVLQEWLIFVMHHQYLQFHFM